MIAVCSWSLQPANPEELVERTLACGVRAVQLHLDPIREFRWRADETASRFRAAGIRVVSGMMSMKDEDYSTLESIRETGGVRPDATWPDNFRAAEGNAILAQRLGLRLVTFHAGFLPHEPDHPLRLTMIDRLRQLAGVFAARGVAIALETGQESAPTLLSVLDEINHALPPFQRIGVNFDPANMILYGMGDPIEALASLMPHVRQVHIKDATPSNAPVWGTEVAVGTGQVDWPRFFQVLGQHGYRADLVIEREAGDSRIEDVRKALHVILPLAASLQASA